jgi:integrase
LYISVVQNLSQKLSQKPRSLPKLPRGEGSLRWDPERHCVELRHQIDGRTYRERAADWRSCVEARDRRRHEVASGRSGALRATKGDLGVNQLIAAWLARHRPGRAPQTVSKYEWAADLIAEWGARPAAGVSRVDVEDLIVDLVDAGTYAQASMVTVRSVLRQAYEYGIDRGLVTVNPAAGAKITGAARKARKAASLDADEFGAMRAHLADKPSTLHTALLVMLVTAVRPGEALGLCWTAVDLDAGTIEIVTGLQRSEGGRVTTIVDELKTDTARRTVELPTDAVAALRRERKVQAERRLRAGDWPAGDAVFTTATGRTIDFAHLARACRRACVAIGTSELSPNALRHSCASMLCSLGVSLPDVAAQLGHVNTRMASIVYAHAVRKRVPTAQLLSLDA